MTLVSNSAASEAPQLHDTNEMMLMLAQGGITDTLDSNSQMTMMKPVSRLMTKEAVLQQETRFDDEYKTFTGLKKLSLADIHSTDPKIVEVREILMDPRSRQEMIEKSKIRPDVRKWNKEKLSRVDLD